MASNSCGVFAIFFVHISSVFEVQFLKITTCFRYLGVVKSNQNNLHEEFNCLIKSDEYIASEGTGFDSSMMPHILRSIMALLVRTSVVFSLSFAIFLCKSLPEKLNCVL
jgi:hypothetical protein